MKQGVHRAETPRDRRERAALEADVRDSGLAGKPLRTRLRNFRIEAGGYLASLGGPLPWMQRLREIELQTERHERDLDLAWRELAAESVGDPEAFARDWLARAEGWNFHEVNDLIARHNRNYPAEARLPMNPRTGDFVLINGRPYTREPLDARWILERFPAVLEAVPADEAA